MFYVYTVYIMLFIWLNEQCKINIKTIPVHTLKACGGGEL